MVKKTVPKKVKRNVPIVPQMFIDPMSKVDSELIDIAKHDEQWSEFTLKDGATIKLKAVAIEIRKVRNKFAQNGDPIYLVKSTVITDTKIPDSLKKKE